MLLSRIENRALRLPRPVKRAIVLAIDCALCVVTVLASYYLRLGQWIVPTGLQLAPIAVSLMAAIPLFIRLGLYRAIFRYSGSAVLGTFWVAGAIYFLVFSSIFTFIGVPNVPRTLGLIQPLLLLSAIALTRSIARFWLGGGYQRALTLGARKGVLIYGAGNAGRQLAAALNSSADMSVAGFIDDDPALQGSVLYGKSIFGPAQMNERVAKDDVRHVLLAMPSATRARRAQILEQLKSVHVQVRTLPNLSDIAGGRIAIDDLRELDIEDLLGRDSIAPNQILLARNVTGQTVMVTGAGGSIGSELCRRILQLRPRTLLLFDSSEFALYSIHRELEAAQEAECEVELVPLLGSVTDALRLGMIMASWHPDTVYHAAAYKHVPLVEHNPAEGVRNNAFGTLATAQAAIAHGVRNFVLISTDKAVRPANIMGASKRLAEMIVQALSHEASGDTKFSMVRFGNVLGSSGSVVPLFRGQIKDGGPVTITHEDVTRYFMSIPEAAELVIQAGAMAKGGEVFVLDMDQPILIADLARNMIELSGLQVRDAANPGGDIAIEVIGLRPGEKLYEELLINGGEVPTNHPRIMQAREPMLGWSELRAMLDRLEAAINANDIEALRAQLSLTVGGFAPVDEVVDYVHRRRQGEAMALFSQD